MRWKRAPEVDLPTQAINGNLIFARDRVAGVYRLDTVNYGFLSTAEKKALHGRLATWAMKVEADFSIYRVCREYPADRYADETVDLIDERFADRGAWERLLAQQSERLRSMRSFTPEVYAAISLQRASRLPWARPARELSLLRDADEETLETLLSHLGASRARTRELQWLFRRPTTRGVCEPDDDSYWQEPALSLHGGVWESGRADVQAFMPVVEERPRHVRVTGEDGESIQALLVMGKLPAKLGFPGPAELLFAPLEKLDFPVDAVAHVHWVSNKKMLAICDDALKDSHDERDDASARFVDKRTAERPARVAAVQEYFATPSPTTGAPPPGFDAIICLAVGAPADRPDLLSERVKRVRRAYGNVRLYQPHALQAELFFEHYPRPDGASSREYWRDYRRLLVAEQLAAMMPIGSNEAGAKRGIYSAYTISPSSPTGARRPVKVNPREAIERGRTGAIFMNGALGSGKTLSMQWLTYLAERSGAIAVDIDPKKPRPDHSLERWPGMEGRVDETLIDSTDAYRGQLDPLICAPPNMREELGSTFMMEILPETTPEWKTAIIGNVREVLSEPSPSSWKVVERLLASQDQHAHEAGKALAVWADWGTCKLAFSHGDVGGLDVHKPLTMIKSPVLSLPLAGTARGSYSQSERISVEILKLIIAKAMRKLEGAPRNALKVLAIDEVHVFTPTTEGRQFLEMVIRMARFMGIVVVLGTQMAGDLGELDQLIGMDFIFRQETDEQAQINLRRLGLDPADRRLVDMLMSFDNGACLMRGLDKRIVPVRFDPGQEILAVADTNPDRAIAELEQVYAK